MQRKGDTSSYLQEKLGGEIARGRCAFRPLQVTAIRLESLVKSCMPASSLGLTTCVLLWKFLIVSSSGSLLVQDFDLSKNGARTHKKKQLSSS